MIALLTGAGFSLIFTLLTTPLFIKLFNRIGWGQFIRDDGPQSHHAKRGTPTMGGIVFIIGAVLGYFVGHLIAGEPYTLVAFLVMFLMWASAPSASSTISSKPATSAASASAGGRRSSARSSSPRFSR